MPTYQQLYSIPASIGADVAIMNLRQENGYLPDLDELRTLVTPDTKMICINNPNNPTGALMSRELLEQIIEIARSADAYILCDEVYRHLTQTDEWCEPLWTCMKREFPSAVCPRCSHLRDSAWAGSPPMIRRR